MVSEAHALSRDELVRVLTSYSGITTADGDAGGTWLVDAGLIASNDFVTGKTILIMSGNARREVRTATIFNPVNGRITVDYAFNGGQILAGTYYRIINFASAEIIIGLKLTTYGQEAAGATNANGATWVTLLDKTVITKLTELWGITLTIAGGWAGLCQLRIIEAAGGTKIFPFAAQAVEGTDFVSAIYWAWPAPVRVPIASGYKVQFRSTNGADVGAPFTCALTELAKIEIG